MLNLSELLKGRMKGQAGSGVPQAFAILIVLYAVFAILLLGIPIAIYLLLKKYVFSQKRSVFLFIIPLGAAALFFIFAEVPPLFTGQVSPTILSTLVSYPAQQDLELCKFADLNAWAGLGLLSNKVSDSCIALVAKREADPTPCTTISQVLRSSARYECFQQVCNSMKDDSKQEICDKRLQCDNDVYADVDMPPNAVLGKGPCYRELALETNDSSYCNLIDNPSIKSDCYQQLSSQNTNQTAFTSICSIQGTSWNSFKSQNDCENCQKILDSHVRATCYASVASQIGAPSICDNIQNSSIRESCYVLVATSAKNVTICNLIETDATKADCLQLVSIAPNRV